MIWHWLKRTLLVISLLVVLGVGGSFAVAQLRGGKMLSVQTGSMVPKLNRGDLVSVSHVPAGQLAVGDIVTYINPRNKKQTITHRIIQTPSMVNNQKYIVKGDANRVADAPVDASAIIGKVNMHVPYAGYGVDFVRKPIGLAILIYIPALLIIIDEIRRLSRYYREKEPYALPQFKNRLQTVKVKADPGRRIRSTAKYTGVFVALTALVAFPVHALLMSQATLTQNTISATRPTPPPPGPHVTFKIITLRCSSDNTLLTSKRPKIVIQNWTHNSVTTHNWRIVDNSGTIITIPDGTVLKKLKSYTFTPLLADGLQYAGDHLALLNDNNQMVDALSWGTDTTAFDPNIPTVATGSQLERRPFNVDTDKASDWRVFNHVCHCPLQPDVQAGDDAGGFGDLGELNRVTTVGAFNMSED
jgi:signal peptidase I